MRLIKEEDGRWKALFTLSWEVVYLLEQEERWIPFCLNGCASPIGEIHATTHEVRLYAGIEIGNRQAVALAPLSATREDEPERLSRDDTAERRAECPCILPRPEIQA